MVWIGWKCWLKAFNVHGAGLGGHGSGLSEARDFCGYVATHLFTGPTCGKLAAAREYARAL